MRGVAARARLSKPAPAGDSGLCGSFRVFVRTGKPGRVLPARLRAPFPAAPARLQILPQEKGGPAHAGQEGMVGYILRNQAEAVDDRHNLVGLVMGRGLL